MASYPNSVISFATRTNGQTIDASHVNGPQDEITAIEDGLLNATARLNSSNSTVANLSVTGGSTFTGAAVFSTTVTLPREPSVKVYHSAAQQIPNGAWQGLSWDSESYLTSAGAGALHSTTTNSSRINLTSSGIWAIGAQLLWLGNATPIRMTRIFINGSSGLASDVKAAVNIDPYPQQTVVTYYAASTSDYVTIEGQCSGSTGRVTALDNSFGPTFAWAHRISG